MERYTSQGKFCSYCYLHIKKLKHREVQLQAQGSTASRHGGVTGNIAVPQNGEVPPLTWLGGEEVEQSH